MAYKNLNYDITRNGELWLIRQLADIDRPILYDVGANRGTWALGAARVLPGAEIHCFEICPATFRKLTTNVGAHGNIRLNPFGLSNENNTVELKYFPQDDGKTSVFDYPHRLESAITHGEVRRGDEYARSSDTARIHLLKIDTEGAEHLVLNGFTDMLASRRIDLIQFEYGRINILSRFLLKDYYEFFSGYGYVVGKLYPNYVDFRPYALEDEDFLGPNYVACRDDRSDLIEMLKG